jgi:hypothetical protein
VTRPSRARGVAKAVLIAALAALAAKLLLASTTYGTTDVRSFLYFFRRDAATGPVSLYEQVKDFNHPPPMIFVLRAIHGIAEATGLPFSFWLRLPAILADLGTVWIVARYLRPAHAFGTPALVLCALAPVSILVSGFHGNTDPAMICLVVLSVALLERSRPAWIAGAVFGLALDVKVVPLVFGPAILAWLPGWRKRVEFFGAAFLVVLTTWSPVVFAAPALVARRVLGYGSSYGILGLSRILSTVPGLAGASAFLQQNGRWLLALAILGLAVWMNRPGRKVALFHQVGITAFAFLAATPGFGVQYLAWLVPFTAALPLGIAIAFHAVSGAFLAAVYTYWCQVPPELADPNWLRWSFWTHGIRGVANANRIGPWKDELVLLEAACWGAVAAAFARLLRAAPRSDRVEGATESRSARSPGTA